ncbi:g672 [Coccomyxa viridis]|uniref:G672 protein n=1 Tax=Coccomyxa viridis TaxID=1274662 RepID=A0ABP1FGF6_9CHLO
MGRFLVSKTPSWAPTLVVNIAALSLASYLALVYQSAMTRRILAEAASGAEADIHRRMSDDYGKNISALVLSVVIGSIATAAGVGGGAFFVPLFNILLNFSLKGSMALSQAVIAGGAIAGVAVTLHKKHPHDPARPLMDFDIALMLLPFLLLGVSFGVLANVLFPNWLITVMLLGLLIFLTYKTGKKALSLHRCEVRYLAQREENTARHSAGQGGQGQKSGKVQRGAEPADAVRHGGTDVGTKSLKAKPATSMAASHSEVAVQADLIEERRQALALSAAGRLGSSAEQSSSGSGKIGTRQEPLDGSTTEQDLCKAEEGQRGLPAYVGSMEVDGPPNSLPAVKLGHGGGHAQQGEDSVCHADVSTPHDQHNHDGEAKEPPAWRQVAVLLFCWGVFVMFTLLLSHYPRCSVQYWAIFGVQAVACIAAEALFIHLVRNRKARQAVSSLKQPMLQSAYSEPPVWTLPKLIRSAVITLVSGAIAGLLGIGGGMIVNPLLLEFNIHPQAAAATSTLMVLFSASSAALSFGFGHQLNLHFALIFGLCCMGASLIGVLLVQRIVKRSGKASIIVFLLALVIATGVILTAGFGGRYAILDLVRHSNLAFSSLCSSSASS